MTSERFEVREALTKRVSNAGLSLSTSVLGSLAVYFELLRKWNRRLSLTSLPVETLGDEAIDRLVVEPLLACRYLPKGNAVVVDVGSGGGSPAIPMRIVTPEIVMIMTESRGRKAAFLREAVRVLGLERTSVRTGRFEELRTDQTLQSSVDVITVRAVRIDAATVDTARSLLKLGGSLCLFASDVARRDEFGAQLIHRIHFKLLPDRSYLDIFRRIG